MDSTDQIRQQVLQSFHDKTPFNITAGGSKNFLGVKAGLTDLDVSSHSGIISYEPSELVITAKAGTTLAELQSTLAEHKQMLPFEPPMFGDTATIGGTIACGLSGPARPYIGAARDFVLGCTIINGSGQQMAFGGQVMKNVAGYDVTRLMTGAMGTLGIILDVSMKVLPVTETEMTLLQDTDVATAITTMQSLAGKSLPVTASAFYDGQLFYRLAGSPTAVQAAAADIGGNAVEDNTVWHRLREHKLDFFNRDNLNQSNMPLWRLSLPPLVPELDLPAATLYDWAGTQRWLYTDTDALMVREIASKAGGTAQLFRASDKLKLSAGTNHPPSPAIMKLHHNLKKEFDPALILNPGRLYAEL